MANLIDMIRTVITPDVVRDISSLTGESDSAARNAIDAAIPSVLSGVVELGSTQAGAERLSQMISDGGYGTETVSGFGHLLADENSRQSLESSGTHLLTSLFGSREEAVARAVAEAGSVRTSSASQLMRVMAPLVLGVVGQQISALRLDARGLMNMILGERSSIMSALPPGVARAIGISEVVEVVEETRPLEHERARTIKVARRSRFRPAVIGTLAVLTLLFFLTRNREREEVRVNAPPAAEIERLPAPEPMPSVQPTTQFSELDAYMSGPKDQPVRVFILEGVTYESGSSRLKEEAKARLKELAAVLKAHPETRVRIEGHTDEQGSPSADRRLSLDRANAVKAELVSGGADAGKIDAKGLGSEPPVAADQTATGTAPQNRTVLVVVKR